MGGRKCGGNKGFIILCLLPHTLLLAEKGHGVPPGTFLLDEVWGGMEGMFAASVYMLRIQFASHIHCFKVIAKSYIKCEFGCAFPQPKSCPLSNQILRILENNICKSLGCSHCSLQGNTEGGGLMYKKNKM